MLDSYESKENVLQSFGLHIVTIMPRRKRVKKNEDTRRRARSYDDIPLCDYIPPSTEDEDELPPTSSREKVILRETCGHEILDALLHVPERIVFGIIVTYSKDFVERNWPTGYIVFIFYLFIFLVVWFECWIHMKAKKMYFRVLDYI